MMFQRLSGQVASATAFGMDLADESQLTQQFEGTIYRDQSDLGIFRAHLFIDIGRGEMIRAANNDAQHSSPLRSDPVALLPEKGTDFFLCEFHR